MLIIIKYLRIILTKAGKIHTMKTLKLPINKFKKIPENVKTSHAY